MAETETRAAFITAALVLLVMPMVYVIGLASIMLVMRVADIDEGGRLMLVASALWGLIVLVGVLMVARRLIRRSARA